MGDCTVSFMNVRGCDRVEKQDLIERMIIEKRFYICAFSETKLKGSGEFIMGSIKARCEGRSWREMPRKGGSGNYAE
jgi:hypothetical protein